MAARAAQGCRLVPLQPESFRRIGYAHVPRQFRPARAEGVCRLAETRRG
jgi:hypothetical protein